MGQLARMELFLQDPFYFVTGLCILGLALVSSISLSRAPNGERRLPPGPRGLPIVGNLLQMGRHPHRTMAALAKRYGHIMFLRLGQRPTVVIDSIELVSKVTKELDHVFCSRPPCTFAKIVTYDQMDFVMAPYGPHWKQMRRLFVNQLLAPKRMLHTAAGRSEENLGVIKGTVAEAARTGKVIDMREQFIDLSQNVMCRMLVGELSSLSSRMQDVKHIVHEAMRIMGYMPIQDYLPFLGYWFDPNGVIRAMRKVRAHQDRVLDAIIQEHRDLASGKLPGGKPDDIISTMLDTPGLNGEAQLDQRAMKACISDMLAATDTSTITNEWAMTEILRHPHIQHKLQTELDSVVGLHRIVEESDLPHFPYLTSIFKEALRLHPTSCIGIPRLSMADAELAGYHIPKGTTILINLFSVGRDESVWKRPLDFDPERHMSSPGLADDRLYVFGNGRRACPGYALGTMLVMLTLARLFHGFEWAFPEGVDGQEVDMEEARGFANSRRSKLMAVATPRLATHLYGPDGSLERHDSQLLTVDWRNSSKVGGP